MGAGLAGVGCVLEAAAASEGTVRDLVSRLGVNTLFVRGPVSLSGLKAKAPALSPDGAAPGLRLSADDSALRQALDRARGAGLDPYLVVSNPFAGRAEWSDLLAMDSGGRTASNANRGASVLCPNRPKLLKWLPAAVADAARVYKPAGILLEDFSLGSAAQIDTVFMCWCDQCQTRIGELGYDVDKVRIGLQGARSKLEGSGTRLTGVRDVGLAQFIEAVGYDTGLLDWFNFRADAVSACLFEIRQAVLGVDRGIRVGVLQRSPTVALLAGQRRVDALRNTTLADFYVPVLSGRAAGALEAVAAHAELIRLYGGGMSESEAIALSAALHGYGAAPLPATIVELAEAPSAKLLAASVEHELRLTVNVRGEVPRWPAIDTAGQSAAAVADASAQIRAAPVEGLIYLGAPK